MDWAVCKSLVNTSTGLHVTTWSIYRPSCRSQPGQHTDRAAGHNLVNIPTELQVTAWSTYRPSCRSQPGQHTDGAAGHLNTVRNMDTDSSVDLTHPRHFREGNIEWRLTNVNITLYIQISSKSFDQVRRYRWKYSTARNMSKLLFSFMRHAIQLT